MTRILLEHVSQAHQLVGRLTFQQKEQLVDDIFKAQPNLLASVLALSIQKVPYERIESVLNILFMTFEAVRFAGLKLPVVSEDVQEMCLKRLVGKSEFVEGLSVPLMEQAIEYQIDVHTEKYLLALVFNELREHDILAVRTDVDKVCVLVSLNLVETIAHVAKDA